MAADLEQEEGQEVDIIKVISKEESFLVRMDQTETEGAEVEVVIVMIVANAVDLPEVEKDVQEDTEMHILMIRAVNGIYYVTFNFKVVKILNRI